MVLIPNDTQHPYYKRSDLHCMNLLLHPVWVFDVDHKAMYWANTAALEDVWNAATLDELLLRDFASDMSEAAATVFTDIKNTLLEDPYRSKVTEQWTFYPRGGEHATTVDVSCSAIRISADSSHLTNTNAPNATTTIAILVEAELLQNDRTHNERMVRSIELLKHIPVAVSQFSMDGTKLIYQNPKASQLFGTPSGTDSNPTLDAASLSAPVSTNVLLQRFVDVELGKDAIALISETDEEFSAEVQQYTTCTVKKRVSSDRLYKRRTSANKSKQYMLQLEQEEHRWFNISLRKARDPVTSDFLIIYIARDISDIVKARKDSMQAAMKSEFLDIMAHEIRTPLHQIIGHTDLLEDTCTNCNCTGVLNPLNSEQLASVRQIQSSCSMLISIINDLLDCSKIENGHILKEEVPFDLGALISSCMESIRPQVQQKKGLQVSYHIDANCNSTRLISDPNRLQQILINLLSNAIKFTSVGSVTVTVQPFSNKYNDSSNESAIDLFDLSEHLPLTDHDPNEDSSIQSRVDNELHLQFEVTDTGIGIASSEQSLVFERYRQANASVARTFGGTGLGLPICKGLVELLGGNIGIRSEIGVGTTVYFDIPFRLAPDSVGSPHDNNNNRSTELFGSASTFLSTAQQDELASEYYTLQPTTKPIRLNILVVEDNEINQKVVKSMLQRLGHIVSTVENGEIALEKIRQEQFHLVLMDIQMPVMDGIECTRYIRNVLQYDKDNLPIIGLTAGYQPADRDYYENDVGMNSCVGKPLPMNKLKAAIAIYCQRPSKQPNPTDTDNKRTSPSSSTSLPALNGCS